jgi:hypothetical protein
MSNDQPDELPQDDLSPSIIEGDDSATSAENGPPPAAMMRRVEQVFSMMQVGSPRESMLEKLDSSQISKVIQNAENDSVRQHAMEGKRENSRRIYACVSVAVVIGICWLFLAFKETDHLDAVITALIGLMGGYGLGTANSKNAA